MNDLILPIEEQIWGDTQLEVLKKIGTKCTPTDFAILLGAYVNNDNRCWWWSASPDAYGHVQVVDTDGDRDLLGPQERDCAVRPASLLEEDL